MEDLLAENLSLELQQEAANEKTTGDRLRKLSQINTNLAQLVAQNPGAPAELLEKLATRIDVTTRQNVAANPNTPTEVLLRLANEFPREVLSNPVFPLLFLENLNILNRISQLETLWKIVLDAQTSTEILSMLVHHENIWLAEAARLHVNLAGEMTHRWDEAAREAIGTADWRETLGTVNIANSNLSVLDKNGFIPDFAIAQLARHQHWMIRCLIADKISTPVQFLEQLARDEDSRVRESVARNPNTPVQFLEQLAQDQNSCVRACVAQNSKISVKFLEQLAKDLHRDVRLNVAQNPNAPLKLLEQLVQDTDYCVRKLVAKNPNAPLKLLEHLVQDKDYSVRKLVAQNPNAPVKLLQQLAKDRDSDVRDFVAANPNTPVKLLELLARDKNKFLRGYVAKNPSAPLRLLEQLAQDKEGYVRQRVASNPKTSVKLLEQLAQDQDSHVRGCVAHNPNIPLNLVLEAILKDCQRDYTPSLSRFFVLLHPQTSGKALAENGYSNAWLERYAIAQHVNTPLNTLHTLAQDANRIVRAAAKANLQRRH
jgi:3-methyladenine DNA glycosylase AlkC